jgi:hypothetical protein
MHLMRYITRWVAAGVLGLTVSLATGFGGGGAEMAENPYYKHWAGFKEGTTVVLTQKTTFGDDATDELPGGVDEKIIRYKLVSVSPERAVVESSVIEKEFLSITESPPTKIIYPAKVKKAYLDAVLLAAGAKFGDETLKVKVGKGEMTLKCKTIAGTRKKKDEEVRQKYWLSTSVPGGIVKRVRTTMHDGKMEAETTTLLQSYKAVK